MKEFVKAICFTIFVKKGKKKRKYLMKMALKKPIIIAKLSL